MKTNTLIALLLFVAVTTPLFAQDYVHDKSDAYEWPTDTKVLQKLDKWQDQKFGMLIHFGLYSKMGICESWPICSEDWINRDTTTTYEAYKRKYWSTINEFKPDQLDPASWASYGKKAGIKYVVFSTKHHDGFCLFDTKQTDFNVTKGAFKDDPRRNVAKEVFGAFRKQGYMIGCYFSKPDWHCQYYWWDKYATPNRNNNYSIAKNPWRWNQFKQYTYNQIQELMNGDYGSMDILWLDGGWVRPARPGDEAYYGKKAYMGAQDIDMPKIAAMARSYQPGLLVVDRTVPGKYENYQTPEQAIPAEQLENPWESCITLGGAWGFVPGDHYKSASKIIHTLAEVVAKGGALLLGVGPSPEGVLPDTVKERLVKIGEWTSKNGEAIYKTRNTKIYHDGATWFTQSKDGKTIYAIACLKEGDPIPATITWKGNTPLKRTKMRFIQTGKTVSWKLNKAGAVVVSVPKGLPKDQAALAFAFEVSK